MRLTLLSALIVTIIMGCSSLQETEASHGYRLVKTIPLSGEGGWDYVKFDKIGRRVFVTHDTQVQVLDADSAELIGVIDGLHGVHGMALAQNLKRGFISNGLSDSVTIFNLQTLEVLGEVKTGKKPDALAYDDLTRRLLAFNGDSNDATVIDGRTGRNVGRIALGAGPEFAVPDDQGHVFVNLEDTGETLMLDVAKLKVMKRWSVAPGQSPSSLALDRENHRLFIGCRNRLLAVMDADDGHVIATLAVGDHVDATAFDPETHDILTSAGDGTLTVVHQDDADHYHVAQTLLTRKGSRTFGLDVKTHRLFVPAAEFAPPPAAPTKENHRQRPAVIAGSFTVLIYDKP